MAKDNLSHIVRPSAEFPRTFVDTSFTLTTWEDITPYYTKLLDFSIQTVEDFITWSNNRSEVEAIIIEEGTRRYINMTCYTEDKDNADLYSEFIEKIDPEFTRYSNKLNKKMLEFSELDSPKLEKYQTWIRDVKIQDELFREENIAIDTAIGLEIQKYQKVTGSMSIDYHGEVKTMQQVLAKITEPDRAVREEAWKLVAERRLQDREVLNKHFDFMLQKRIEVAKNCGYDNYLTYIFKAKGRYDYTPQDCYDFHNSIKELIVPLDGEFVRERKEIMNLDTLRPWDMSCDPHGRPPLKPFKESQELIDKTLKIFTMVDPELGDHFRLMKNNNLLDLDSRLGKAPGGYQCALDEQRLPYIFMNAVGTNSDVYTLLHEGGHSFHQMYMKPLDIISFRDISSEIAEVASMSMELIGGEFLSEFYSTEEVKRARKDHFNGILELLPWVATVDSFQHWIYSNPTHTPEERNQKWLEIFTTFNPHTDWSGFGLEKEFFWQKQLHIFEVPFYYIEYGIAQIGALQVYKNYKENPEAALAAYKKGLSLGSTKPLPELFEAMNIKFDFSKETLKPLVDLVIKEIKAME